MVVVVVVVVVVFVISRIDLTIESETAFTHFALDSTHAFDERMAERPMMLTLTLTTYEIDHPVPP